MSKIIIAADIHCGVRDKLDDCLWALKTIRKHAYDNDISVVVILGDLFHDRVNLNIRVISDVADFLDETKYKYNQEWLLFPGNHDMFMRHSWNVNSLRPIKRLVTLIDDVALIRIEDRKFRIVPFIQKEEVFSRVLERMEEKIDGDEILLTHAGISGAKYNSCFLMQHWGIVDFSNTNFSHVFAGHFHCMQEYGNVHIPGSPIPFRFDEGMVDHGFFEFDLDTNQPKFININSGRDLIGGDAPPDYITVPIDDLDGIDVSNNNIRVFLGQTTKPRDELDRIRKDLMDRGAIKVAWMKTKEEDREVPGDTASLESSSLLKRFIEFDKPKGLNKQLLLSLNKQIIEEAFDASPDE